MVCTTSDQHKRQRSYLENRCEDLRSHNEHLMGIFKMFNDKVVHLIIFSFTVF